MHHHTTLGRTGLKVSVAGLGTGGFSRLGLKSGLTEDQSARLVHEAFGLGVNFIDTAPGYGTEGVVGKALKNDPGVPSGEIVTRHIADDAPDALVTRASVSLLLASRDAR